MAWNEENRGAPETPGSSAQTAVAVGVGSVVGAVALVAVAPILLPMVGLGAAAVLITPVVGGAIGAITGWWVGGKK
jgi:ABC-type xylose transport system permease subunit